MLKIIKKEADSLTGHITVHAHVVEKPSAKTTVNGSPEVHGISAQKLKEGYGGDVKKWLARLHAEMLQRHADRKIAAQAMSDLEGVTLFEDEDNTNGHQASPAGTGLLGHADEDTTQQPAG